MASNELRHSEFFKLLTDFGYFADLDDHLPSNFTSIFEIARVLEDESSELFRRIEPAMTVRSERRPEPETSRGWRPNRHVPTGNEYDIDFIRGVGEVRRILPNQFALPRSVFMRRLARRELIRPVARVPVVRSFGSSSHEYSPNHFKQKVYLLLDTSASMLSHHRFQMAKATAYVFLKRNLKELGHVYFRTFDRDIGPLHTATDLTSLRNLVRHVMRLSRLGNGTAMERAILTACEDIRRDATLSGAEILIITDGAAHLDRTTILEALGASISINTIKIGEAKVAVDDKILADEALRGSSPESHALAKVRERIRHLEFEERNASTSRARSIAAEVASLRSQASRMESHIVDAMRGEYGREIESLSRVFVNIEDIAADEIFHLSKDQIDEIRKLVVAVSSEFRRGVDAETLKEVALLYEHISMLIEEGQKEGVDELSDMQSDLGSMLDQAAEGIGRGRGGLTRDQMQDLGFMMQHRSFAELSIGQVLRSLLERAVRAARIARIRVVRRKRR